MSEGQQEFKVDDADSDARAAFAEVMSRTKDVEPVDVQPADTSPQRVQESAKTEPEQKPAEAGDSNRDELGRFKPKAEAKTETPPVAAPQAEQKAAAGSQPVPPQSPAEATPLAGPPPSWSVAAKTKWEAIPQEVRAEIAKREGEVAEGMAALRDYKDLRQFNDMARSSGTTLAAAMQHYVNMENVIRRDPAAGLALIAQNAGMTQQQAAQMFAGLAQKFGGGAPGAQMDADDPLAELVNPMLQPLLSKVQALEGQLTARQQQEFASYQQTLDKSISEFASDPKNRFFPNLADSIAQLFESGMVKKTGNPAHDLQVAYDMAARLHPEVSEALIEQRLQTQEEAKRKREQEAADKAKAASRSISGSRAPGTVIRDAEPEGGADDVEADVRRALRQLSHT